MTALNPNASREGTHQLAATYRARVTALRDAADEVQGTMTLIVNRLNEVLDKGGTASIQPQIAFLTSALMRMQKDWGVVEMCQQTGAMLKGGNPNGHRRLSNGVHHHAIR